MTYPNRIKLHCDDCAPVLPDYDWKRWLNIDIDRHETERHLQKLIRKRSRIDLYLQIRWHADKYGRVGNLKDRLRIGAIVLLFANPEDMFQFRLTYL